LELGRLYVAYQDEADIVRWACETGCQMEGGAPLGSEQGVHFCLKCGQPYMAGKVLPRGTLCVADAREGRALIDGWARVIVVKPISSRFYRREVWVPRKQLRAATGPEAVSVLSKPSSGAHASDNLFYTYSTREWVMPDLHHEKPFNCKWRWQIRWLDNSHSGFCNLRVTAYLAHDATLAHILEASCTETEELWLFCDRGKHRSSAVASALAIMSRARDLRPRPPSSWCGCERITPRSLCEALVAAPPWMVDHIREVVHVRLPDPESI